MGMNVASWSTAERKQERKERVIAVCRSFKAEQTLIRAFSLQYFILEKFQMAKLILKCLPLQTTTTKICIFFQDRNAGDEKQVERKMTGCTSTASIPFLFVQYYSTCIQHKTFLLFG